MHRVLAEPGRGRRQLVMTVLLATPATAAAVLLALPRYRHFFPSMVDDWYAISQAPSQAEVLLHGRSPEPNRYRPGLIFWSLLQWHTLGAPRGVIGPVLWNIVRSFVFATGVTALAALLTERRGVRSLGGGRLCLVALVPFLLVTVPGFAVDLVRFETQEPLLLGLAAGGAALIVRSLQTLVEGGSHRHVVTLGVPGVVLWSLGVLQKESAVTVLLAVPFLVVAMSPWDPEVRVRWRLLTQRRRSAAVALVIATLAPVTLMLVWTTKIVTGGSLIYGAEVQTDDRLLEALHRQVSLATGVLGSPVATILFVMVVAAGIADAFRARRVDWISVSLLAVAFGVLVFAAESTVLTSRYLLPVVGLLALALARLASRIGERMAYATAALLAVVSILQIPDARSYVRSWVDADDIRTAAVRDVARRATGCRIDPDGGNLEFALALPVLLPLAGHSEGECEPARRYVVIFDGNLAGAAAVPGSAASGCAPADEVATFASTGAAGTRTATIVRCGAR